MYLSLIHQNIMKVNTKIKKILSLILATTVVLSTLTVSASTTGTGKIEDTIQTTEGPASNMKVSLYDTDEQGISKSKIAETTTDTNGKFTFSGLSTGLYNIKYDETKYKINGDSDQQEYNQFSGISVSVTDGKTATLTKKPVLVLLRGNIELTKYLTGTSSSINGATYAIYKADDLETKLDEQTTDQNGKITFSNLPYGNYKIKETSSPEGFFLNTTIQDVSLTQSTKKITVYDDAICKVKLIKSDENGTVLKDAVYDLFRDENIPEKIGQYTTDDNGEINVELKEGNYYFLEVKAPNGYEISNDKIKFTLDAVKDITKTVEAKDKEITYNIYISKVDEDDETKLVAGAELGLYKVEGANDVLISKWKSVAGEKKYITGLKAGSYYVKELTAPDGYVKMEGTLPVILNETQTPKYDENNIEIEYNFLVDNKKIDDVQLGIKKLNEKGSLLTGAKLELIDEQGKTLGSWTSDNSEKIITVKYGKTYTLKETKAPDGYIAKDSTTITINDDFRKQMEQDPNWDGVYHFELTNAKEPTYSLSVKKTDDANNQLCLDGAKLQLVDNKGMVIDEWTTARSEHVIHDLKAGTYTLKETEVPEGYLKADDIKIEVGPDITKNYNKEKTRYEYTMVDESITATIEKRDKASNEFLAGAVLGLYLGDNEIYRFTTTDTGYVIKNIIPGSYILKEISVPEGYKKAEDMGITVEAKQNQTFTMYDEKDETPKTDVDISKLDGDTNKLLAGAKLSFLDKDGKAIDSWTSEEKEHIIKDVVYGKYTIKETLAPEGYEVIDDIEVEISKDNHSIVVKNYKIPEKIDITVNKIDGYTNAMLAGAKLQFATKDGTVIDEWDSTKTSHIIKGVEAGEYKIHEIEAPEGYEKIDDMIFEVNENNKTITVKNYKKDEGPKKTDVKVSKVDGYTDALLKGATLKMVGENGQVIDTWTSEEKEHIIKDVAYGKYTIKEIEAPEGYTKTDDMIFEVNEKNNSIIVKNYYNKVYVYKYEDGTKNFVEGAILHIEDEKGKEVDTWTTKDEKHEVKGLEIGKKYILIEDKAPDGYKKADNIEFKIDKNDKETKIRMYDKKSTSTKKVYHSSNNTVETVQSPNETTPNVVATGDNNRVALYGGLGIASIIAIIGLIYLKRKNK